MGNNRTGQHRQCLCYEIKRTGEWSAAGFTFTVGMLVLGEIRKNSKFDFTAGVTILFVTQGRLNNMLVLQGKMGKLLKTMHCNSRRIMAMLIILLIMSLRRSFFVLPAMMVI